MLDYEILLIIGKKDTGKTDFVLRRLLQLQSKLPPNDTKKALYLIYDQSCKKILTKKEFANLRLDMIDVTSNPDNISKSLKEIETKFKEFNKDKYYAIVLEGNDSEYETYQILVQYALGIDMTNIGIGMDAETRKANEALCKTEPITIYANAGRRDNLLISKILSVSNGVPVFITTHIKEKQKKVDLGGGKFEFQEIEEYAATRKVMEVVTAMFVMSTMQKPIVMNGEQKNRIHYMLTIQGCKSKPEYIGVTIPVGLVGLELDISETEQDKKSKENASKLMENI